MINKILYIISFLIIISFVFDYAQNEYKILYKKRGISQNKLNGLFFLVQDKNATLMTIVDLLFLIPFPITFIKNMNKVNRKKHEINPETKSFVLCDLPFY